MAMRLMIVKQYHHQSCSSPPDFYRLQGSSENSLFRLNFRLETHKIKVQVVQPKLPFKYLHQIKAKKLPYQQGLSPPDFYGLQGYLNPIVFRLSFMTPNLRLKVLRIGRLSKVNNRFHIAQFLLFLSLHGLQYNLEYI